MTDIQRIDLGLTDTNSACSCCAPGDAGETASVATAPDAASSEYLVDGMTCSHCVASVTEELTAVDGVERVAVELRPGAASVVTVTSARPIGDDAVRAAVEEAGYTLAASRA
ncbi:MAG TPA: heavy-metal-associated domain-containing protein [Agromyces sp.]|nr:heavy-metal-associated domain-containing protein [Agromyces sp.]